MTFPLTTFVSKVTKITADWAQAVNDIVGGLEDTSSASKGAGLVKLDHSRVYPVRSLGLASYGRPPATWAMSDAQVADVTSGTGVMDVVTELNSIIATGYPIDFTKGVYGVSSPVLPRTQQALTGKHPTSVMIRALAGFAGSAVVSYPFGQYNAVQIRGMKIDAANNAARCLELIGVSQGTVDSLLLEDMALSRPTTYSMYIKNMTYFDFVRCVINGGTQGGYLLNCYTGAIRSLISYDGQRAGLIIDDSADLTLYDPTFFNSTMPSTSMFEIDRSHGITVYRGTFEPEPDTPEGGHRYCTQEVLVHDSGGTSQAATDNRFIDCNWIGLPATKQRCLVVGDSGGAQMWRTRVVRGKFVKPAASNSVLLNAQSNADFTACVDLASYASSTHAPVSITNTGGGPYQLEGETQGTFTVAIEGATTNPTITSGAITGTWTRQGRQVFFSFNTGTVTWSAAGTGGFRLTFTGLDFTGATNTAVNLGSCDLFTNAVSAQIINATQVALFPTGSNTSLNWSAPPTSGRLLTMSGTFIAGT